QSPALLPAPQIEVVQVDVAEQGGKWAALRGAGLRVGDDAALPHPGPEPCRDELQDSPVTDPLPEEPKEPVVIELVEEAADIGPDRPAPAPLDLLPHPVHRLVGGAAGTEAKGAVEEVCLEDRREGALHGGL